MIKVRRLNGSEMTLNAELIEWVEASPDTTIALVTGNRFIVQETVQQVVDAVVQYKKKVYAESRVINPIEGYVRK